ncbi:MAG: PKD domain-containing protein [Planctomycetes bacterium]|nr:PKD domain-containing protein [Planctomycetota bacterium]MCB9885603.1 PKD domain-containing protein [Planctomycetota bacterium]
MYKLLATSLFAASLAAQSPVTAGVQPNTTNFVGGLVVTNTAPPPVTELFDVTVTDPNGITVTQFDCNVNTSAGTTGILGVWITGPSGTHVGNQTNNAAWTQVATQTITHAGGRVTFQLPTPFFLAAGTYGMALHYQGANPVYTNPATPTPPLPLTYSTNEVTLDMSVSRVRASDPVDPFGGTSAGFSPRHANVAMYYTVGAVSVDFGGTPLRGASPLPVQFTSFASSGNPGGILAYAWDLDGDQIIDSTAQNPVFVYNQCGNYTVSLTVVDALGAATATKVNYVQTDIIVPGFTNALIAPNTVQFTDTSSPTPATWAWDLDGDSVVDSTLQNPIFLYSTPCSEVTVTLTTTLACQPAVTLTKKVSVASSLETTFQGGLITTATATGGVNYIDVDVTNPDGITVCGMHVNSGVAANNPLTVNVYQKQGTYVGAVETAADWRLVGTSAVTSLGGGQRTFVTFNPPIYLAPGVSGLAIEHVGASPVYTNMGGTQVFSNADLTITAGLTQASPIFGPAATSTQFSPRIWNGALHYSTSTSNAAPGYGYIGAGCAGSLGVPGNVASSQPTLGGTAVLNVDNVPLNAAFFLFGLSRTSAAIGALPFDLAPFGAAGCMARVSPDAVNVVIGANNAISVNFGIPSATAFVGVKLFTQALVLDPSANALGGVTSDAAAMIVGQ